MNEKNILFEAQNFNFRFKSGKLSILDLALIFLFTEKYPLQRRWWWWGFGQPHINYLMLSNELCTSIKGCMKAGLCTLLTAVGSLRY